MKRKFSKVLFLIGTIIVFITNLNAFELTYSDWSLEYPLDIDEILIESQDRYYWYKDIETNVKYLLKEDILEKLYDENDVQYFESEELLEKPEEKLEREILEIPITITYNSNDVKGILIQTQNDVQISEIIVKDNNNLTIECNSEFEYLTDGDLNTYYDINNEVYCYFNNKMDANDLAVTIYASNDASKYQGYNYYLINENKIKLYRNCASFKGYFDFTFSINNIFPELIKTEMHYKYVDKLYKTYELEREFINDYYEYLEGYNKDERTKKTFYRYITNDYIIVDENNQIVTDENYCKKEFCRLIYLTNEVNEIIDNPKTYDGINKYFISLLISLILIIIIVKKCRLNKKSSFVESI